MPKKLVLAVIDSLKPEQLDRAVAAGQAPVLAKLLEDGTYVARLRVGLPVGDAGGGRGASPPGSAPTEHRIPSMNWYHRGEERYVEYGSSFPATRAHGVFRSLFDTVYNMNMAHLSRGVKTVFEHLDDAGLRTAGTTYLIWRGRHRHEPSGVSMYRRVAEAAQFRHPVWGPEGVLLRRPVRLAGHRLHGHARHARPARPPQRLRGGAPGRERPVRLPALLAARQRRLLPPLRARGAGTLDRRGRPRAGPAHGRPPAGPRRSWRTTP